MTELLIIASFAALFLYCYLLFKDNGNAIAIKLRKDGSKSYERVSTPPQGEFPILLKIIIFITIAGILFMPLDFILNRNYG